MTHWTAADIPSQADRTVIVTGANSGIGYHTALELALRGAHVIAACRSAERGADAVARIRAERPAASVEARVLDLADLESVRAFAHAYLGEGRELDLLVNNAAVMGVPERHESPQGFELQFATNHLGGFALTGLLLPAMRDVAGSRIVTVSSLNHRAGRIHFDDLQLEHSYGPYVAYNQSKLANALFVLELDRRLRASSAQTISVGAHPGYTHTALQTTGPRLDHTTLGARVLGVLTRIAGQSPPMGALPTLFAATAPGVHGGQYFGPSGPGESRGYPRLVEYSAASHDRSVAERLWAISEELTSVSYDLTRVVPAE
jgi:NAD(P)-dependent dehydrogenase (short-subunit alcohol dehydrogenase family)